MTSLAEFDFQSLIVAKGCHASLKDGMSFMEAVAYIAGEPHAHQPESACPAIAEFCNCWNDSFDYEYMRTKWMMPFLQRIPGTRQTPKLERSKRFAFQLSLPWSIVASSSWFFYLIWAAGGMDGSPTIRWSTPFWLLGTIVSTIVTRRINNWVSCVDAGFQQPRPPRIFTLSFPRRACSSFG